MCKQKNNVCALHTYLKLLQPVGVLGQGTCLRSQEAIISQYSAPWGVSRGLVRGLTLTMMKSWGGTEIVNHVTVKS